MRRDSGSKRRRELFNEPARTCIVSGTRSHPQQPPPPPPLPPPRASSLHRRVLHLRLPFLSLVRGPREEDSRESLLREKERGAGEKEWESRHGPSCTIRCLRSFRSQSASFLNASSTLPMIVKDRPTGAAILISETFGGREERRETPRDPT